MTAKLARYGVWGLPIGGLLTFIPWLPIYGSNPDPIKDPTGVARMSTSSVVILSGYMYIVGTICILFGLLALYLMLADTAGANWAAVGAIGGAIAMIVVVGIWAILTVGDAIVGDTVLAGHTDAGATFKWMSGGNWNDRIVLPLVALGVSGVIGTIGMTVGLWRSGRFRRWIAIAFAVAFLLEVASSPISLVGALVLAVTGFFIASGLGRRGTKAA